MSFSATNTRFGNLHLRFRRLLHTLKTSTAVFDDRNTLWQPPPSFSTTVTHFENRQVAHFDHLHLRFQRQLHTFATSRCRRHFRRQLHTLTPSTVNFNDSYTLRPRNSHFASCLNTEHSTRTISAKSSSSTAGIRISPHV